MVAARAAKLRRGRPETNTPIGGNTQPEAAQMLNVGKRTVQRARKVLDRGTPELVRLQRFPVRRGCYTSFVGETEES